MWIFIGNILFHNKYYYKMIFTGWVWAPVQWSSWLEEESSNCWRIHQGSQCFVWSFSCICHAYYCTGQVQIFTLQYHVNRSLPCCIMWTHLYLAVTCEQIYTWQYHVNRSLPCSIMWIDLCLVVSCEQIFTWQHHVSRYHTSRSLSRSIMWTYIILADLYLAASCE